MKKLILALLLFASGCTAPAPKNSAMQMSGWRIRKETDDFSGEIICQSQKGKATIYYEPFYKKTMLFLQGKERVGTFIYYYRKDKEAPVHGGKKFENDRGIRIPLDSISSGEATIFKVQVVNYRTGQKENYSFRTKEILDTGKAIEKCMGVS